MKTLSAAVLAAALFIAACSNEQPATEPQAEVADPTVTLHALFDEFFETITIFGEFAFGSNAIGHVLDDSGHTQDRPVGRGQRVVTRDP